MPTDKNIDAPLTPAPKRKPSARSRPPTTTEQEDKTVAGQRRINLIWEITQAIIAITVTVSTMSVGAYIVVSGRTDTMIPTIFSMALGMVTGFYFSRTNHQAIGGIGNKADKNQEYKGR